MHLSERQIIQSIIDLKGKDYFIGILKFIQRGNDQDTINTILEGVLTCILGGLHISTSDKSKKELDVQISALQIQIDSLQRDINMSNRDRCLLNEEIIHKNNHISLLEKQLKFIVSIVIGVPVFICLYMLIN